jgi:hypothetical protein
VRFVYNLRLLFRMSTRIPSLKKSFYLLSGFFLMCTQLSAQYSLEAKAHFGFVIPHRNGVDNLIQDHVQGLEINLEKQTSGLKHWHHQWNLPKVGLSFYGADLGNPKQLGYSFSLFPYIKFSTSEDRRLMFQLKMGSGIGYVTKAFDPDENHKNVMIGSRGNISAGITGETRYQFSKNLSASAGLSLMHYSNASYKVPNLGINLPSISLGLDYAFNRIETQDPIDSLLKKGRFEGVIYGTFGLKENYPIGRKKYPIFGVSTQVSKYFGYRSKVSGTFDIFYNTSIIPQDEPQPSSLGEMVSATAQGFMLSYGMNIDKLSLSFGQGIYIRSKYSIDSSFYHRIAASYVLNNRIALRWVVKTHFFKADNFEIGIGYRFL